MSGFSGAPAILRGSDGLYLTLEQVRGFAEIHALAAPGLPRYNPAPCPHRASAGE
jgi:hypothetical protein